MRGNPLLRLALAVAVFLLLGIPVWRLTRAQTPLAAVTAIAPVDKKSRTLILNVAAEYETPPQQIQLQVVGDSPAAPQEIDLAENGQVAPSKSWTVTIPAASTETELLVTATWPDPKRHALRVRITGADVAPVEKTLWLGGAATSDVLSLPLSLSLTH